jgi:DNA-binding HxlR family transcriptional regulator
MKDHTNFARMAGMTVPRDKFDVCPVEVTADVIGGKWKPLILFYTSQQTRRFNELRRLMPGVTQQMLTLQLRELERDGAIHREVYPQVPPKVEYSLTELGRSLIPLLMQMFVWGERYMRLKQPQDGQTTGSTTHEQDM